MKFKKLISLFLVFALSLSLFSCFEDGEPEETEPKDYYASLLETAAKNADTGEYYFEEFDSEIVTTAGIAGLTNVFLFSDASFNKTAFVYKFNNVADANTFRAECDAQYKNNTLISVNAYDNVIVFGYSEVAGMLERGEVYEPPVLPDFCSYRDTRDTEGREIVKVKMTVKNYGEVVILLDATTAPITVANFTKLVSEGFYTGLTFHRVIKNFMIQGGDPLANGTGGSDEEIFGEFSSNGHENDIKHLRGVISMARSSNKDSASSQFFICNADASHLDGNYAAFGYVISGLNVVDAITRSTARYGDSNGGIADKTKQAVIEKIEILP